MDLRTEPENQPDYHAPAPAARDAATSRGQAGGERSELELLDEHALRRLLAGQPVIEQAKGLLMGHYRLDPDRAFTVLSRWSSRSGVKVRDLATQLVQAAAAPGLSPFDPVTGLAMADDHADPTEQADEVGTCNARENSVPDALLQPQPDSSG